MKRATLYLLAAILVLTFFTACGGELAGQPGTQGSDIGFSVQEGLGATTTVNIDKAALAALTLEARIQMLKEAAGFENCNSVHIIGIYRRESESEPYVCKYFTEDGRTLTITQAGADNHWAYCGYGFGIGSSPNNNYIMYYYGEIPENGNLDNVPIKGIIDVEHLTSNSEFDLYLDMSAEEYLATRMQHMEMLVNLPEQQKVLSIEEAIFYIMEDEGFSKEFGVYCNPESLVKVTYSNGWYYFQSVDLYFYFNGFGISPTRYHGYVGISYFVNAYHGGPQGTETATWAFDCFVNSDGTIETFMF